MEIRPEYISVVLKPKPGSWCHRDQSVKSAEWPAAPGSEVKPDDSARLGLTSGIQFVWRMISSVDNKASLFVLYFLRLLSLLHLYMELVPNNIWFWQSALNSLFHLAGLFCCSVKLSTGASRKRSDQTSTSHRLLLIPVSLPSTLFIWL